MSYTKFGEFARVLRIQRHEIMGDMADKLGVSSSFLSSVENGKKNVPSEWAEKISVMYGLSPSERKALEDSIEESKTQYKISTENAGTVQRQAAMEFARSFDDIDEETASEILELLKKKTGANSLWITKPNP